MNEIYRVSLTLSDEKEITIKSLGVYEEKEKTYKNGNKKYPTPKVIKKEKLLVPKTIFNNNICNERVFISYHTFCRKEDVKQAKLILQAEVEKRVSELLKGAENLKIINNSKTIENE